MYGLKLFRTVVVCLALAWPAATAGAQTFDVKSPEVKKGETEVSTNHSLQGGFPDNADPVRHSWELAADYGFSDRFKAGIKANFDTPVGEHMRLSTAGVETQIYFGKLAPAITWGWFTEVDAAVHRSETNTVVFGPLIQFGDDKRSLTFNTLFERTFGRNRDEGIAFTYAVGLKARLREGVSLGVEGHGTIPDIGHALGIDRQEHRVGPVLYLEQDVGPKRPGKEAPKLSWELGVLAGLTEATPDVTAKIKASLTW
jgi:hypothetical protein